MRESSHKLNNNPGDKTTYLYTFACHEEELSLCRLESRSLFGKEPEGNYLLSPRKIDPSRSPFMKMRISLLYEGRDLQDITQQVASLELGGATFKVVFVETKSAGADDWGKAGDEMGHESEQPHPPSFDEQRAIEREVGRHIRGKADMRKPERVFAIVRLGHSWLFGECSRNEAVWLKHMKKPQNYSTALSTRVARAIVNIAVPNPDEMAGGVKAVDPCCGIGTVLIEARSMGIDIDGFDINPLAVRGARQNLAHFGYSDGLGGLAIRDMRQIEEKYDVAILDLPYNLCSVLSLEELLEMLQSARGFSNKAVIVTTESIHEIIEQSGFRMEDRCIVTKGTFARQIIVCL